MSKRNGEIGIVGGFAVFPDYETGKKALIDSLKNTYGTKSLSQMIIAYAPEGENDTKVYLHRLRKATGVLDERRITQFSTAEFEKLVKEIESNEGKAASKIFEYTKKSIIKVMKNKKGVITNYYIDEYGWFSKTDAIRLVKQGKIDAVLSISASGKRYIRTRPDVEVVNNLELKG